MVCRGPWRKLCPKPPKSVLLFPNTIILFLPEAMKNPSIILFLLVIAQISRNKASTRAEEYKAPEKTELAGLIRYTLKIITALWEDLSETNNVNHHEISVPELLRIFINLNRNISLIESTIYTEDFHLLKPMWIYAQTEADVMSLNSYYDAFRRLQDEVEEGKAHSQLAWTDLAETYLQRNDLGLIRITDKLHHHVTDSDPTNLFELTLQVSGEAGNANDTA